MDYSTPNTRSIQWTNSGITFIDRKDIVAVVSFPCGAQGPVDGTLGSPERKKWEAVRESWIEQATLPTGAYFPHGLVRGAYSQQFILEVR